MEVSRMNDALELASKLMDDIIAEDPLEFQELCIGEEEAKQLILMNMTEKYFELKEQFTGEQLDAMMISVMSKLALENYLFYLKQFTRH